MEGYARIKRSFSESEQFIYGLLIFMNDINELKI